jgi:hypothetical protein
VNAGRQAHLDEFYPLLGELARHEGGARRLGDCTGRDGWPRHGVYFFFEDGQSRADGASRVVRVGTHALRATDKTTMWGRLRQHRGRVGGRNPGGGNHRASVFRRHVGTALVRRDGWPGGLLAAWASDSRLPEWADLEDQLEREVSQHIRSMPFLWLAVPNQPDGSTDRSYIERNSIALLSCLAGGPDQPSSGWLGHHATSTKVGHSGLWNSDHVEEHYNPGFLKLLASLVENAP